MVAGWLQFWRSGPFASVLTIMPIKKRVDVVGTVGVPGNYGGFETLVENLARFHHTQGAGKWALAIYCSTKAYSERPSRFLSAQLNYVPFQANGIQSVAYDAVSLGKAMLSRADVILVLGVSGAVALPIVRIFSSAKIITNSDGIEWRRDKWSGLARKFLKFSEWLAIKCSHQIVADNEAIADYVQKAYGRDCQVIAYGGDHALADAHPSVEFKQQLPEQYACTVCRIEPENNIHLILKAFADGSIPIVVVGNWKNSEYGRALQKSYRNNPYTLLFDPIYDLGMLKVLRENSLFYVHGHSAGGTNPSLVEAMHFGRPVIAFDCDFNRYTTENEALYFRTSDDLLTLAAEVAQNRHSEVGRKMQEVALRRYCWKDVAASYFDLFSEILERP